MRRSLFRVMSVHVAAFCCAFALATMVVPASAAELYGLTPGPVELKSAGPLSFGPSGILFVGDAKAAKVYAINTDDEKTGSVAEYDIDDLTSRLANALDATEIRIADLAVNPETGNAFLSVVADGKPAIAKVSSDGTVEALNLDKIPHSHVSLPNAPEDKVIEGRRRRSNPRDLAITDLAYTAGRVLVSGLAAGDSPSAVREFDFPFNEASDGFRVEIFHAAHGRRENYAPIQTFVPFNIGGEPSLLAGYTCTPLVKIPIGKVGGDSQLEGTTVAELGNRNRPLDIIVYKQNGKDYLLMANSARGVMKINTDGIENNPGLTEPVSGGGVAGQGYQTIESLQGVTQLDKLNDNHALIVIENDGTAQLKSIPLP